MKPFLSTFFIMLLTAPLLTPYAMAETQGTGTITGVVTDIQGVPISGICLTAWNFDTYATDRFGVAHACTQEDGVYELVVPAGTYLVVVDANYYPGSFVSEAYANINSFSRISEATPVEVASGQTVSGVDFDLPTGYTVSGRLVDAEGMPVAAGGVICDRFIGVSFGGVLGGFGSSETGEFRVNVLPGTYDLSFDGVMVARGVVVSSDVDLGTITYAPVPVVFNPKPPEGYTASLFIPSTGLTAPADVAISPYGDIYVASCRSGILKVTPDGEITTLPKTMFVYNLDLDAQGNLYAYSYPGGIIYKVTADGQITTVTTSLPVTCMESGLAVGPTGDIYVAYNGFTGDRPGPSSLLRVAGDGTVTTVIEDLPYDILALAFDSKGQLFASMRQTIVKVSPETGALVPFVEVPSEKPLSAHGMTIDASGNIFVSTGWIEERGELFKITPESSVTKIASIPENGLQGIAVTPSGEIIGAQRTTGSLLKILSDGTIESIVPANGLCTPQAITFSPSGELFISNGEAGMVRKSTSGEPPSNFVKLGTYSPPWDSIAFDRTGAFYYSEGMPGFPSRLVKVSPEGEISVVSEQFDRPAGLAFDAEGNLFVAEYMTGKIWYITPEGAVKTFVTGLDYPESMAFSPDGDLFVTVGFPAGDPATGSTVRTGIVKVTPNGEVSPFTEMMNVQYLAFSPSGGLFAGVGYTGSPTGGEVYRIEPDGAVLLFATGFLSPTGLAFDVSGDLFVADDTDNSITRITGFPAGRLAGTVKDAVTGRGIEGATVSIVSDASLVVGTKVTADTEGGYSLKIAPGSYTVSASASGYGQQSLSGITVVANESQWVELVLTVEEVKMPKPAEFKVTDLSISPTEAEVKQTITISVKVTNIGEQKASYTVDLKVAGVTVNTRTVTLSGGESTTVIFELAREEAGTFDVEVFGLRSAFVVMEAPPPPPWELYVTIATVVIVAIGVATVIYMRKRVNTH